MDNSTLFSIQPSNTRILNKENKRTKEELSRNMECTSHMSHSLHHVIGKECYGDSIYETLFYYKIYMMIQFDVLTIRLQV